MAKDYFIDEESGVLKNRLGISDKKTLDVFERRVSQDRATQSIDNFDLSYDGYGYRQAYFALSDFPERA